MKCCIDDREQDRGKRALTYYAGEGLTAEIQQLTAGDFVFKDNNITVAFEYKTIDDFIHSITDNRVFNQAINQSEVYNYHYVIVVGTEKDKNNAIYRKQKFTGSYVTNNQLYGAYASLVNITSLIQVPREEIAFYTMLRIAVKCCDNKPVVKRFKKAKGNPALKLLANNVNGIGLKTAERICEELDLVCIEDVFQLDLFKLMSVTGVGERTAENILKQLKREFN